MGNWKVLDRKQQGCNYIYLIYQGFQVLCVLRIRDKWVDLHVWSIQFNTI